MYIDDIGDLAVLTMGSVRRAITAMLSRASSRISIYTYLISPNASWFISDLYAARSRGVDIKVVLNNANRHSRATQAMLSRMGIKAMASKGFLHTKIYIFDDYVIIGSANISNTIDKWIEYCVAIRSRELADTLDSCLSRVSERSERQCREQISVDDADISIVVGGDMLGFLREVIESSRDRIYIMSFVASTAASIVSKLSMLRRKRLDGTDIRILLNGVGKVGDANKTFAEKAWEKGIKVYLSRRVIHAKLMIADDIVIIGSHNLTASSRAGRIESIAAIRSRSVADITSEIFWIMMKRSTPYWKLKMEAQSVGSQSL
jgi:phosphatidylserine/phosphatidylglycerophosphate/cardiolipin synthase-like enzyme